MAISGRIVNQISNVPTKSDVLTFKQKKYPDDSQGDARKLTNKLTFSFEGFFNSIYRSAYSLLNRSFPCILLNPDFNILSANGTAPITPAQGTNYEVVSNWFLMNGGGSNNYTITPTAYSNVQYAGTGSRYFLNINVPTLDSPLYLYNLNYSLTDQFNSVGAYNRKKVTFSAIMKNNSSESQKARFNLYINSTGQTVQGGGIFLQPNMMNEIVTTIEVPDLNNMPITPGSYIQPQFSIEDIYGSPLDIDLYYLKAEFSNYATPLEVNHVLEQLTCTNLT
jgi:hypothetical protein